MAIAGRAVQSGLVPFEELPKSPTINADRKSRTVERVGVILWVNIDALILECVPDVGVYGRHPTIPYLYVDSIKVKPFHENASLASITVSSGVAFHELAEVTISYARVDFEKENDGANDNLLTRKWSFSGELMTLPGNQLQWIDGTPIQQEEISASKLIPSIEHSITLLRRPSIPWNAIRENIGKVCDGDFESASDETLLFSGAEVSFEFNATGSKMFTLDLRFNERFIKQGNQTFGWNHFYRKGIGWQKITDDQGELIYPKSGDFADLFSY
jgi:hypothetical protein